MDILLIAGAIIFFLGSYSLYYVLLYRQCLSLIQRNAILFGAHLVSFGGSGLAVTAVTGAWDAAGGIFLMIGLLALILSVGSYLWERRLVRRMQPFLEVIGESPTRAFDGEVMVARRAYVRLRRRILGRVEARRASQQA